MLAGCGSVEPVTITPQLTCADKVVCHVVSWRIGVRAGPNVAGTHITCRCEGD